MSFMLSSDPGVDHELLAQLIEERDRPAQAREERGPMLPLPGLEHAAPCPVCGVRTIRPCPSRVTAEAIDCPGVELLMERAVVKAIDARFGAALRIANLLETAREARARALRTKSAHDEGIAVGWERKAAEAAKALPGLVR